MLPLHVSTSVTYPAGEDKADPPPIASAPASPPGTPGAPGTTTGAADDMVRSLKRKEGCIFFRCSTCRGLMMAITCRSTL